VAAPEPVSEPPETIDPCPPTLAIHALAVLPASDPASFFDEESEPVLAVQLREVADVEGPVPEAVLFARVSRAWGLERVSARLADRLRALVPDDVPRTIESLGTEGPGTRFYWPAGVDPEASDVARVADDGVASSRRAVEEVCVEELSNLVNHVLREAGAASRPDVVRSVCRLIGAADATTSADARVDAAIDASIVVGALIEEAGRLRPAE
jgi:hypothetical protein